MGNEEGTSASPFIFVLGGSNVNKRYEGLIPLPVRETQSLTRDKVVQHMEKSSWVVTRTYGNNYYDVQKGSTLVLSFDFNTGMLTNNDSYSNDNPVRHERVFNTTGVNLHVGDTCLLGYRGQDIRQKPFIKKASRMPFGQQTTISATAIDLALWCQAFATPFLSRSVPSSVIHPFSASSSTVWTGTTVVSAFPMGPVVDASGRIITAQGIRDVGDTFWEKVRISLQIPAGTVLTYETAMSISPSFWFTSMWTNDDASLVFVADLANRQVFRKRDFNFEQITLTDLNSFDLFVMSVSPLGHVFLPSYIRTAAQTYTVTAPYTNPAGTTTSNGVGSPSGSDKCRAWDVNTVSATVARAWEFDPASQLQSVLPIVHGLIYGGNGNGQAPCSIYGAEFVTWASGRPRLPAVTPYNQARLVNFDAPLSDIPTGYDTAASKSVEGVLMGVSASSGSATWTHRITVAATEPSDYGLLGPLDTFLSANYTNIFGAHETYLGVCGQQALTANVPGGYGPTVLSNSYFPAHNITWNGPDYAMFFNAAVVMLPREAANTTQPRDIGGSLNNIGVFTDYIQPGILGTIDQTLGVVGDKDGNYYFAYLEPVGLKVAGLAGAGMGVTNGCWGDFTGHTTIDPFAFPMTRGAYLVPDIVNTYRRKLRKISNSGGLLLEYDLSQLLTASWYENESTLWTGFPGTPIGGDSNAGVPMADNVWKIVPCGRVVFLIIDYHVLGANYQPATQLQILDANSANVLHTVELRLDATTIPSNIYATGSATEYFVGDGVVDTFTLQNTPTSVISVTVDGAAESYSQSGADIIFSSPPGSGLDVVIDYEFEDTGNLVWRAGERRYFVDPLTCDIRSGYTGTAATGYSGEWAAIEVQQTDRTGASSVAPKTFLIEIDAVVANAPVVTSGSSSGAGRSVIAQSGFLQVLYDGHWKINKVT